MEKEYVGLNLFFTFIIDKMHKEVWSKIVLLIQK